MTEIQADGADQEVRFCAPIDFGLWHLTADRETTLCGAYTVKGHHISGKFRLFKPHRDCTKCYRIYRTRYTGTERPGGNR